MSTMKAIFVHKICKNFNESIRMNNQAPRPNLSLNNKPKQPFCCVIKVGAVSLSPLDTHQIDGDVSFVFSPAQMPFAPGGDVSGTVVEVSPGSRFKVGDKVITTISEADKKTTPFGAMAEYARVIEDHTVLKPENLTFYEACHLTTSAMTALKLADVANVGPKSRVLVTGATGGVGNFVMQLLRARNPELLMAVSSKEEMALSLGADQVVDYRKENFWDREDLKANKLTHIIDCAGGRDFWKKGGNVLKSSMSGGKYMTIIGDERDLKVKNVLDVLRMIRGQVLRGVFMKFTPWWPSYELVNAYGSVEKLQEIVNMAERGSLKVLIDSRGPFPFTEQGVRDAYTTLHSHHTEGKIGVEMQAGT